MTKDDEDDEFTRIEMEQRMRQEWRPNDMAYRPNGVSQQAQPDYRAVKTYHEGKPVYVSQPAQEWSWVCNECGAKEFTSALSEADLEYLACAGCGCNEFHKEPIAQPAQEPVAQIERSITAEQFAEYFHPRTFLCTCGKSYNLPQEKS